MEDKGDPIHGEVVSANASGGVAAKLYSAGTATERTLATTEYLEITDIIFDCETGGTYAFVADSDAVGRRIAKGEAAANTQVIVNFSSPFVCPKGVTPKLIADAGNVALLFQGRIRTM
jgi:hypothetical protein